MNELLSFDWLKINKLSAFQVFWTRSCSFKKIGKKIGKNPENSEKRKKNKKSEKIIKKNRKIWQNLKKKDRKKSEKI